MRKLPTILSLAAIILAGGGAAQAADDTNLAKTILADPAPTVKSRACFLRRYDAQHMAQHPKQRVTDMMLLAGREKFEDGPGGLRWQFQLSAHFTNRKGRFESSGDCSAQGPDANGAATRLGCFVECDGGSMSITPSADSTNVIARVDGLRYWTAGSSQEEPGADDKIGYDDDDKTFRLDRVDLSACTPLLPKEERKKLLGRKKTRGS